MFDSVFMSVWRSNSHYLEVYREWFLEARVFAGGILISFLVFYCFRAGLVFLVSSFVFSFFGCLYR